jgi:hypothetical protein
MQSSLAQTLVTSLDVLLSIAAFAVFLKPDLKKNYPWMFRYLAVRAITAVIVEFLLYGPLLSTPLIYTQIYFVVHWASYLVSAVALFMSCLDVYRQAMAPLPGLVRMGTTVFRWAAIASILVTATTFTSITSGPEMVTQIGIQLMRCVGTSELCLLAFLLLSMKAIGLSPRSRPFGMALGLGLLAGIDCAQSSAIVMQFAVNQLGQALFEVGSVLTLAVWIGYSALPEPSRAPVALTETSPIYKWDQIASALGHKTPEPVLQPAPSFFLIDVEKVVDRAFVRTLKGKESES